jgi:hypothetical protein
VLSLALSVPAGVRAPERVEIELHWTHTTAPVRLVLPFPAKGARAFDADGSEFPADSFLAIQRVAGVRLAAFAGDQNPQMSIEFSGGNGIRGRKYRLCSMPGSISTEVRLQDYAQDMQHLLSADDDPDANVTATLRIGGAAAFRLRLARYAAKLERSDGEVRLDAAGMIALAPQVLETLPVMALRLERPGDEALQLPAQTSEGVPCGSWLFSPETREPGSWLIYPGRDAPLPFRPTLWPVKGDVQTDSRLAAAISQADEVSREAALDEVIAAMADDFTEPCWAEVELLANQFGHLPLATLDVWRRFARRAAAMAALALRFSSLPRDFLVRFALELPFVWEAVPYAAWKQAVLCLHAQCASSFGPDDGAYVFRAHLDARIKDMVAANGALQFLLGLSSADHNPEAARQRTALRAFGQFAFGQLFDGDACRVMDLRRAHADDEWPTGLSRLIEESRRRAEVAPYLCPTQMGFADGVINVPLLVAVQAATGQTESWFDDASAIHMLRRHRAFDPEWFEDAFNLTIARCLAAGLLNH